MRSRLVRCEVLGSWGLDMSFEMEMIRYTMHFCFEYCHGNAMLPCFVSSLLRYRAVDAI